MQTVASQSSSRPRRNRRQFQRFGLGEHLRQTASAPHRREHVKIGLQNTLTTWFMNQALRFQPRVPDWMSPRDGQFDQVEGELHAAVSKDKHTEVMLLMPLFGGIAPRRLNFQKAIRAFEPREYPNYYLQPFHSLPGGWLNPTSMTGNAAAFRALYWRAHRHGAPGIREEIAQLVPRDAKLVYDFGASVGDQCSAMLQRLGPDARVVAVEPSPWGHIVGRADNPDSRIDWRCNFVEELDLPENSADVVNYMFVAHECPDHIKRSTLEAAYRVLKPGGVLIWTDPPADDLEVASRGFFEPYRQQWLEWDPDRELKEVGFKHIALHQIVDPKYMWTRVCTK